MALIPTFSVALKTTGTNFYITDTTGAYDGVSNPGGYGAPNEEGSEILSATIRITSPSGELFDYDVTGQIPDTVTGDIPFTAYNGDWEDGVYEFTYTVVGTSTYITSKRIIFTPKVDCCIDQLMVKFVEEFISDNCYDEFKEVTAAMYLRDGLHIAGLNKNEAQMKRALEILQGVCELC